MASTYSTLTVQLMGTGDNTSTWGDITNVNLGTTLEEAIVGSADVTFASADVTLTLNNDNTSQTARNMRLRCTGTTGGSTRNLIIPKTAGLPAATFEKPYIVQNDCADSIVVKHSTGTGVTIPAGKTMWVYANGTDVVNVVTHLSSLTLGTPLLVSSGGTGTATAFTAGSVVFVGASGVYAQDNANLFWDNTNDRLGIGTSVPGSKLTVAGTIETTSGGVKYPDATTQTTGVLEQVDIYTTTGSTTWTKPSWAKSVEVILFGGGGGGASGRKGAAGSGRSGGTGGGGGAYSQVTFQVSALSATETVVVGAGGAGGAAQTTNSTNGNAGANGGDSSFGGKIYAPGGLGGAAGTTGPAAQLQVRGTFYGGGPGSTNTTLGGGAGIGVTTGPVGFSGGTYGGGGGGGISSADVTTGGGQGVNTTTGTAPAWKIGGAQVTPANSTVTGNGNSGTNNTNIWLGGESGDGGGASTSGNAFSGGNGGTWGGGGGGGGAGTDSVGNSGAGGTGGNGLVIVISRG